MVAEVCVFPCFCILSICGVWIPPIHTPLPRQVTRGKGIENPFVRKGGVKLFSSPCIFKNRDILPFTCPSPVVAFKVSHYINPSLVKAVREIPCRVTVLVKSVRRLLTGQWWLTPLIPPLRRQRQQISAFEASLVYIVSSRTARAT